MKKAARELEFNKLPISRKQFAFKTIWLVLVAMATYAFLHGHVDKDSFSSITAPGFIGWQAGKDVMDHVGLEFALRDFKAMIAETKPKKDEEN
jgi:hypothetical protein